MPPVDSIELAYRDALLGLVHELYFKKSHYPGSVGRFARPNHDRLKELYRGSGWLKALKDKDPLTCLLEEVAAGPPEVSGPLGTSVDIDTWERAESSINARVRAIFGLLGAEASSALLEAQVPQWGRLPPLTPVSTKSLLPSRKRLDGAFGQPDMLLLGDGVLILIEMKVRGGRASAKYNADQLLKYLRLAAAARARFGAGFSTLHLVTAPKDSGRVFSRPRKWLLQEPSHGQAISTEPAHLITRLPPRRQQQVERLGGVAWVKGALDQMPAMLLDLTEVLFAAERAALGSPHAVDLRRQVERALCFGCRRLSAA